VTRMALEKVSAHAMTTPKTRAKATQGLKNMTAASKREQKSTSQRAASESFHVPAHISRALSDGAAALFSA